MRQPTVCTIIKEEFDLQIIRIIFMTFSQKPVVDGPDTVKAGLYSIMVYCARLFNIVTIVEIL